MRKQTESTTSSAAAARAHHEKADVVPAAGSPVQDGRVVAEEEIRRCAYQKWEAAGNPDGNGVDFWCEAERELGAVR